jgi:hypothetical protein
VNISNGLSSYFMDKIIEEEQKHERRKAKFEKVKNFIGYKEKMLKELLGITKVSSSQWAAYNHHV